MTLCRWKFAWTETKQSSKQKLYQRFLSHGIIVWKMLLFIYANTWSVYYWIFNSTWANMLDCSSTHKCTHTLTNTHDWKRRECETFKLFYLYLFHLLYWIKSDKLISKPTKYRFSVWKDFIKMGTCLPDFKWAHVWRKEKHIGKVSERGPTEWMSKKWTEK